MRCINCNKSIVDGSQICGSCGAKVIVPPIQEGENEKNKRRKFFGIILIVFLVLVFFIGAYVFQGKSSLDDMVKEITSNDSITQDNLNAVLDIGWQEYIAPSGNFSVQFPTTPTFTTEDVTIDSLKNPLIMESYKSVQSDGTGYAVVFTTYPDEVDMSVPEDNLQGSVEGSVSALNGELISSTFGNFGIYKSVDFTVYIKETNTYFQGKNIIVGNSLYGLEFIYKATGLRSSQFDTFTNSFTLL